MNICTMVQSNMYCFDVSRLIFCKHWQYIRYLICDICDITTLVNSKKMYLHPIYGQTKKPHHPHCSERHNCPNAFLHAKNSNPPAIYKYIH